jgi:regulator of sigma E protease
MELKAVSGVQTADWESVNMGLISHIGDRQLTITVAPADGVGIEETKYFDLTEWNFDPEKESAMSALGFVPYTPAITPRLTAVSEDGAGAKAGLEVGDSLVSLDGEKISEWDQVVEAIQQHPNTPIELQIERNGENVSLTMIPDSRELADKRVIGFAGIAPEVAEWPENYRFDLQFGVIDSVGKAVEKTGQVISLTISMLKKLIVGDVGLNNLSGPISIAKGAGMTADYGLVYFLGFLALISVNLGIINLVPLPMLDGGHLLFFAIEAVIRRPVPEKIQEMGYRVGGAIIFSLMAVAIFNDFARL